VAPRVAVVAYALAAGAIAIPVLGQLTQTPIPCPVMQACEVLPRTPFGYWFGIPVGPLGLAAILIILSLASRQKASRLVGYGALAVGVYAAFIQWQVSITLRMICPWCLAGTIGMVVGAVALVRARQLRWDMTAMGAGGAAFALPFLVAGGLNAVPIPKVPLDFGSVNRAQLTGVDAPDQHLAVVFGSPLCPTCVKELPDLAEAARRRQIRLVYRFMPVSQSREERRLAALFQVAWDRGDERVWRAALLAFPVSERILAAQGALALSPAQLKAAVQRSENDKGIGRALGVDSIPVVVDCPTGDPCRTVRHL